MPKNRKSFQNLILIFIGLTASLAIAAFLAPLASKDPDGLDRVSKDLKFAEKADSDAPTKKLPFAQVFDEYSLKVIPKENEKMSTALAGITGTLVVFGLAWGVGKLAIRKTEPK